MTTYNELTTVYDVRTTYLGDTNAGRDQSILDLIRSTSNDIRDMANRKFYPRIETRYFDTPRRPDAELLLDDDLLELTTLTNGDGNTFSSSQYKLYPLNDSPKSEVRVLPSSSRQWALSSAGDRDGAIALAGIWGYHSDYAGAWVPLTTLNGAINASVTALTLASATGAKAGQLWKVDSEFIYADTVSGTAASVIARGVNGSTAASHLTGAQVYVWRVSDVEVLCRKAVAASDKLKNNPLGDTITLGGYQFNTPKDVYKYLTQSLASLGLLRTGLK